MSGIQLSPDCELDLEVLVDTRLLVQANSGGGKSWALRRLLEQTHGKVQQFILDLEGEFSTLREKFDYVLVGKGGDIAVNVKTAEVLARRLLELGVSAIIDLYELKQHERVLFVKRFIDSMINAQKELWHPCLVVVDEAHVFCPEKGKSEAMGSVIDLCTRGRKRGYCAILATQRLSKLHKDAAAECNNKLIGRTGLDVDMKRASEELGFTSKPQMLELRELESGEFFAFGPAIGKSIKKTKIGHVQTTHPKAGSRQLQIVAPPPTSKVQKALSKLNDLSQQANEELRTLEDYKRKIRELQNTAHVTVKEVKVLDETAIDKAFQEGFAKGRNLVKNYHEVCVRLSKTLQKISLLASDPIEIPPKPEAFFVKLRKDDSQEINKKTISNADVKLRDGAMRMLKAAAMFHPKKVTRNQIAILSGFSVAGGTFNTYLSELKRKGWLKENNEEIEITNEGLSSAWDFPDLPTSSKEIIGLWVSKFREGAAKMLTQIANHYPSSINKEELGQRTGFTSTGGTFNTYLSELRRNKLITIQGEEIRAAEELFFQ